jgi:hypothetical protein
MIVSGVTSTPGQTQPRCNPRDQEEDEAQAHDR